MYIHTYIYIYTYYLGILYSSSLLLQFFEIGSRVSSILTCDPLAFNALPEQPHVHTGVCEENTPPERKFCRKISSQSTESGAE